MAPQEEPFSTPRSGLGFALAITLAVVTMYVAGLVVEVQPYGAEPSAHQAAAALAAPPCATTQDDSARCVDLRVDP